MAVSLAISEIFRIKEWHDLKIWVWGRSVTFYWSVIVTIALSCTICPFATLWIFILHLYLAPRRGWPCRNFVKMFDADKPEWLGYRMVKKLWQYVKPFSPNIRTSRTDRQTDRQICCINIARHCADARWKSSLEDRSIAAMPASNVSVINQNSIVAIIHCVHNSLLFECHSRSFEMTSFSGAYVPWLT